MARHPLRSPRPRARLALLLAAAGALASCGGSDGPPAAFGPPLASDLGGMPRLLRWADFDGDGRPDLAFTRNGNAWIARGHGDGTLARPQQVGGLANVHGLAVGDLDADGRPDLVVLDCPSGRCEDAATLSTALGHGDTTFRPAVANAAITAALALAVGDLDRDGRTDVIVSRVDGTVSTLRSLGDGTLDAPVDHPRTPFATTLVAGGLDVADVDRDGRPDVVSVEDRGVLLGGGIGFLAGRGDGTLAPAAYTSLGFSPLRFALADLNRDARLDLALVGNRFRGPYPLSVLEGRADGTFGLPRAIECPGPADTFVHCASFAVGDFDGDGHPDVAGIASHGEPLTGELFLLRGRGDGTFAGAETIAPAPGADETLDTPADLNRDGRPDLVFTGPAGVSVRLARR